MAVGTANSVNNSFVYPNVNQGSSYGLNGVSKLNTPQTINEILSAYYDKSGNTTASNPYTQLKRESAYLKVAAEDIMAYSKSPFSKKTVVSANNDVVQIRGTGKTIPSGFKAEIEVMQVAASQENTGKGVNAKSLYEGERGTNHFTIQSGDKSFNISVNIKSTDTNKDVMENAANAINEKKIGVFAEIKYDTASKQSKLMLTSTKTGEVSAFEIKDVEGFGSIVSNLGLSNKTEAAKDAVYSLNGGVETTSASNEINIGSGITAVLRKADENPVKISIGIDANAIKSSITDFVKTYNELVNATASNKGDKLSDKTSEKLKAAAKAYSQALSRTGLDVRDDGTIKIDTEALDKAVSDGTAERTFQPFGGLFSGGFASRISKISGDTYKEAEKAGAGNINEFRKIQPNEIINSYFSFINGQNAALNYSGLFGGGSTGSLFDITL